ncbi:RNA-dependent ATPase rok1 [Clarireedia jacksonii]
MDVFKLLSRSTKQTNRKGSGKAEGAAAKLPSNGTSANPQLFHDPIPEPRGKKRKRGGEAKEDQSSVQEQEDINFFTSETAPQKARKSDSENDRSESSQSKPVQAAPKLLSEEECRQILKSHRLKVTLLPGGKPQKKIKKSKKSKSSTKVKSSKDEIKQLFPQPLVAFEDLRGTYQISGSRATAEEEEAPSNLDLLAVAPTGSGKTLAFLIPVINDIIQRRRTQKEKNHEMEAVIIAPTKELASQIVNEGKKLAMGTGVKVLAMRKGMRIVAGADNAKADEDSDQEDDDGSGDEHQSGRAPITKADIMVTTPLIFLHALSSGSSDSHVPIPSVRTLVLDEADVLLDPLFREQTLGIWNACTNKDLRVTLWSATMGSNIESLAAETIQSRRKLLELETSLNIIRLVVGLKDSAIPNITHRLTYAATEPGKLLALRQLLHPTAKTDAAQSLRPPFLVFTQTIPRAIALHAELLYDIPAEAGGSSRIAVLHSDLSDSARDHVMTRFRNGEIWVLITTDILSRGVDFKGINGVVNYDVPNSGAAYIHRVGRTGRAGRDGGIAVTFYTKEDIPYVKNVANIIAASEKQAGKLASESSMQKWLLDALPTPSKEEKKKLKKYGVEARRGGLIKSKDGKGSKGKNSRMQISTKSGFERKMENNRRGAIQGSKRRMQESVAAAEGEVGVEDDGGFEGFDE